MADTKTRKYTKEQMISYLEKHGSTLTEAANLCSTSPRTLGRYLSEGIIPSEWLMKIQSALKDRKPEPKVVKLDVETCSACGKAIRKNGSSFRCTPDCLKALGVDPVPAGGWHWETSPKTGEKIRLFPICEKCWDKLDKIQSAKKRIVKGKIATKSK